MAMTQSTLVMATPTTESLSEYLSTLYGLHGSFEMLPGELDTNVRVTTTDGAKFLLRLHAPDAVSIEVDLQAEVLQFLQRTAPGLAVQRIVPSLSGDLLPVATGLQKQAELAVATVVKSSRYRLRMSLPCAMPAAV